MLIKTDLKPKASVRAFIKTCKSIYVVVRLMLIAQLPDNTNHQHPFILGGWWTFDDIIDYEVNQYNLHMFKLEPLVKSIGWQCSQGLHKAREWVFSCIGINRHLYLKWCYN